MSCLGAAVPVVVAALVLAPVSQDVSVSPRAATLLGPAGSGLPEMKKGNWPKYPQKLAKIGHFKNFKWPPIGQKNTAFLLLINHILNISMHF